MWRGAAACGWSTPGPRGRALAGEKAEAGEGARQPSAGPAPPDTEAQTVRTRDERVTRGSERTLRWKGRAARLPSSRRPRCAQRMGSPGSAPAVTWTWPCHGRTAAPTPSARGCVWRHSSRGSSRSNGVTGRGASRGRALGRRHRDTDMHRGTATRGHGEHMPSALPAQEGGRGGSHRPHPGPGLRPPGRGTGSICGML